MREINSVVAVNLKKILFGENACVYARKTPDSVDLKWTFDELLIDENYDVSVDVKDSTGSLVI